MKKRELITHSIILFLISLTIIITPAILPVLGVAGNTTTFNVTATVNSGSPTITNVEAISNSPNEGTINIVSFYFNATHPNGVSNIPATNANIQINQSGVTLPDSGCIVKSTDGLTTNRYECNVTIYYYTLPGMWTINATVVDLSSTSVTNTGSAYTNGNTYGITLKTSTVTFGGNPGQTRPANENPQYLNNTGNVIFNQINLTAFELQSGANIIGAGNFTANTTDGSGIGHTLINNTAVTLSDSSVAISGSKDMYLYLNIPNGVANGTYTSVSPWIVTVN